MQNLNKKFIQILIKQCESFFELVKKTYEKITDEYFKKLYKKIHIKS